MPTYSYVCTACEHRFDAQQSFSDPALTTCPECDGMLRKLFGNVGVVFKGPGFYRTDARAGNGRTGKPSKVSSSAGSSGASTPAATGGSGGSGATSGSGSSGTSSGSGASAPAAASA